MKPVNLKEKNSCYTFRLTIRDVQHFYTIVKWLNSNVGKSSSSWTFEGRVLRTLKKGQIATPLVYIFNDNFDKDSILFLNLL